ncbi:MAG TPA: hypothetical protein VI248_23855 [Kineosporiaceae bacterium]
MMYSTPTHPACFFDPRHGFATAAVAWRPPNGVERPIPVCASCQQRLAAESAPEVPRQLAPHARGTDDKGNPAGDIMLGAAGGLAGGLLLGSLLDDDPSEEVGQRDEDDEWL